MSRIMFALGAALSASIAHAADCEPTRNTFLGGNYKEVTTQKVDVSEGLVVQGKVLSARDCKPIEGARIAHWQANRESQYVDRLRAYLLSGKDGSYRFQTEWPNLNPPHIHFIVTAPGHKKVTTMWVGDKPVDKISLDIVLAPE